MTWKITRKIRSVFYEKLGGIRPDIRLLESTPGAFAAHIAAKDLPLSTIEGELNSGKYGATFPGVFSARTYLKVMASDCERMLFKVCEPLGRHGLQAWARICRGAV